MRVLVAFLAVVALAALAHVATALEDDGTKTLEQLWTEWKAENNKNYGSPEEEKRRFDIFKDNKKFIDAHNEKFKNGEVSYKLGLTPFVDKTTEEIKHHHGGVKKPESA